jgi:hypothetical protein
MEAVLAAMPAFRKFLLETVMVGVLLRVFVVVM